MAYPKARACVRKNQEQAPHDDYSDFFPDFGSALFRAELSAKLGTRDFSKKSIQSPRLSFFGMGYPTAPMKVVIPPLPSFLVSQGRLPPPVGRPRAVEHDIWGVAGRGGEGRAPGRCRPVPPGSRPLQHRRWWGRRPHPISLTNQPLQVLRRSMDYGPICFPSGGSGSHKGSNSRGFIHLLSFFTMYCDPDVLSSQLFGILSQDIVVKYWTEYD